MNNSNIVQMTSDELRAMRERGESRSRPLPEGQEPDLSDPDNPDCAAAIQAITDSDKNTGGKSGSGIITQT